MSEKEFNEMRKKLVQNVTNAAEAWLAYMCTDGAVAAIPNTDPQQYVVAGTLKMIAKVLPSDDAVPAVHAQAELTDEQILSALTSITYEVPTRLPPGWLKFARAIEREVRLSYSEEARNEALAKLSEGYESGFFASGPDDLEGRFTLHYSTPAQAEAAFILITDMLERAIKAEAPAASKEGETE
jgi:hypothetical protein